MEKFDYGQTLNLPQTGFPMRGNLPAKEPEILSFWENEKIYQKVQEHTKGRTKFILHDGPPYANGDIHLGHTLNKILKDIIVKYRSQNGYDAPYVPGWDTHGLPIELQAIKALGINRHEIDKVNFRRHCQEYALKYIGIQREQFKRLGVRGDWENPYLTLDKEFEAEQIGVFGEMAKKGFIYKGLKPVHWCPQCETALAEAEIEYHDKKSPSIYVKFPVIDANGEFSEEGSYVLIWTTTPWTLPANMAIALHPDFDYQLIKVGEEKLLMAKELIASVLKAAGGTGEDEYQVVKEFKGKDLENILCKHPFMERNSVVVLGEHVTLEQGTGCVHTAPGHGVEDFQVGKSYGLDVLSPLDHTGTFTEEAGKFAGIKADAANKLIAEELDKAGLLLNLSFINHQYPHCWRCKSPTMFRATEQWFASIDGFRQETLAEIDKVKFIPSWGRDRIYNMVADRGDWCISRQRTWGVPIPIFFCEACNKEIINDETISHIKGLFREHGSDVWFARDAEGLIPPGLKCSECGSGKFRKETDIMDVWFDSGSSHKAVLTTREDLVWPADLYLEGSDQHRGWFNSSLSTSVATTGKAPYKAVLTHGFLVDEKGRKMSKSLGNGIDPLEVIEQMGADILRLWVSSADYRSDVAASPGILKQVTESYRKIRNTFRYLLGNIYDFNYAQDKVAYKELTELDKWALLKLAILVNKVTKAYDEYEFHVVYHAIHNFCTVDMSAFYLDVVKDRLYTSKPASRERRAAQTVIYEICTALVKMLTPVLAFTAEEVWSHLPQENKELSVQMAGWPHYDQSYLDMELEAKWDKILAIREEVTKQLEEARRAKVIGHSLNAAIKLYAEQELYEFLKTVEKDLAGIFIVSKVDLILVQEVVSGDDIFVSAEFKGLAIKVEQAPGQKCERCWTYTEDVGADGDHPTLCVRCASVLK
ncbi:MAG: isoleucine--tRNA ligase [Bacillota bacterium]